MVGRFLNFLLVPLYTAKLANVADYGEVNVMFSYASFLAVVFTFGMETGFFNFARKSDSPKTVFSTATIALICSGFLLLLFGNLFADGIMSLAGYASKPQYAVWFTAIIAADAITSLGFAWLRFTEKPWRFAIIRLCNIGINIAANLFFLLVCPWLLSHGYSWVNSFYQPEKMVQYIFLSNLIASMCTIPLMAGIWTNLKAGFNYELFRKMLVYSLPMVIVGLAGMVNETLDRVLLKQLLPAAVADFEVGIYGAFYKLSMVLTLFVQAFRFAAEPFFFKQADSDSAPQQYAKVMDWFIYVCGFIYIATLASLPWLATLLIRNAAYFNDARGLSIVAVLLLANMMLGIYYNLSIWYKLSNKTMLGAFTALFGAAITLSGNFLFIKTHSFEASAWTTLAAYASMVVLGFVLGQKYYPVPYKVWKNIFAIATAMVLGFYAQQYQAVVPLVSLITLPAYVLMVWYLENTLSKRKRHRAGA